MLEQFTWQQFLIAALVLSLIWYAVLILLFYRKKIIDAIQKKRMSGGPRIQSSYNPREQKKTESSSEEDRDALIGKTALPDGVTEVGMDLYSFAPKEDADPDADKVARLGLVPDVLEEIKTVITIIGTEGGTKEDFFSLFKLVSAKYPMMRDSPHRNYVNDYIRENVPFTLSQEDVDKLWN